jgi:RNA-binding protein
LRLRVFTFISLFHLDNGAMPAIVLTPARRKELRAQAHHLDPVVMIGADGLTPAVVKETHAALAAHGLVKVRVLSDERPAREALLATLSDQLDAAAVQHIGKLLVLWRPMPAKEVVPAARRKPGPKMVKIVKPAKSPTHRPQVRKVTVLGNQRVTAGGSIKRARKRVISPKKVASSA